MKKARAPRVVAFALFLLCGCASACASDPSDEPLWGKAVELARLRRTWVPGVTVFHIELLDSQGRLQDDWETRLRITPGTDGEPVVGVESATHNGKDVTARERENQARRDADARKKGMDSYRMGDDPFDPDLQEGAEVRPLPDGRTVDGRACSVFAFAVKKKDGSTLGGTALLDSSTGAPVEVSYTVTPLPVGVQKLSTVLRYAAGPAGDGFLREVSFEGSGGLLFVKKTFRSTISLDGYWLREGT